MSGQVDLSNCRVLTIQSHVVSGYVGNKIALLSLQVSGFETDAINSVQFSNHTHYEHFKGQILSANDLKEVYSGLRLNGLDQNYTHLLTGYVNSESFADELYAIVQGLKLINPGLIYLCDPVLGDNGVLYVTDKLVSFYREKLICLATIITPNQFEAEILTDAKITNEHDALRCIEQLHQQGPEVVVISSVDYGHELNLLTAYASRRLIDSQSNKEQLQQYCIRIPKLEAHFVGTGDLFSAIFLSSLTKTGFDLKLSLEQTVAVLQSVLQRTIERAADLKGGVTKIANIELKLVQSLDDIRSPSIKIYANTI